MLPTNLKFNNLRQNGQTRSGLIMLDFFMYVANCKVVNWFCIKVGFYAGLH